MSNWKNLTAHLVRVHHPDRTLAAEIPPSGTEARVKTHPILRDCIGGIPIYTTKTGAVIGLPESDGETMFVASMAVRLAVPGRRDVFSPGELVRDANGQPTGCVGLVANGGAQ